MMTTLSLDLTSAYLKLNLFVLLSYLIWKAVKTLAYAFRLSLDFNSELRLVRLCFSLGLLLPLGALLLAIWSNLTAALPGLTVMKDSLQSLDAGLARIVSVGRSRYPLALLVEVLLLAGIVLQTWRLLRQHHQLSKLLSHSTQLRRIHRTSIVLSPEVSTPFSTQALGRTQIVLPYQLLASPRNLRLAIRHELQHVRSGDLRWVLLLEVLKPLFFWNPAYYAWLNEFHCLQEYACDEALVRRHAGLIDEYGTCLLEVASQISHRSLWASTNMVPHFSLFRTAHSQLKRRIQMLHQLRTTTLSPLRLVFHTVLLSLGLLSGAVSLLAQPQQERPEYLPIVVIQPQYPNVALMDKIEGWVKVMFDVDENGSVLDPRVVNNCAKPQQPQENDSLKFDGCLVNSELFDAASLKAIKRFKFKPRLEDGNPVVTNGVMYVFRYNLSDSNGAPTP